MEATSAIGPGKTWRVPSGVPSVRYKPGAFPDSSTKKNPGPAALP